MFILTLLVKQHVANGIFRRFDQLLLQGLDLLDLAVDNLVPLRVDLQDVDHLHLDAVDGRSHGLQLLFYVGRQVLVKLLQINEMHLDRLRQTRLGIDFDRLLQMTQVIQFHILDRVVDITDLGVRLDQQLLHFIRFRLNLNLADILDNQIIPTLGLQNLFISWALLVHLQLLSSLRGHILTRASQARALLVDNEYLGLRRAISGGFGRRFLLLLRHLD